MGNFTPEYNWIKLNLGIQLNKTEIIKCINNGLWLNIHSTQLNRGMFTQNPFGLKVQFNTKICKISKSTKTCDLDLQS